MIDHVSIPVSDLEASTRFYSAVLEPLGMRFLTQRTGRVGFGGKYPELWLNGRPDMAPIPADTGAHLCLRARRKEAVDGFHRLALENGGYDDGLLGPRFATMVTYYAAFVRDPDGNRIEVMTVPSPPL